MTQTPRLAITLGDPCGAGPEILLKILPSIASECSVSVYGSRAGLALLHGGGHEYSFHGGKLAYRSMEIDWADPTPQVGAEDLHLGAPSANSGKCAVEAVRMAAGDILAGKADALLTLPISKAAAHMAGFDIPGHTELLQQITGAERVQMAFVSPSLKIVLHTTHQSLRSAIEGLDAKAVAGTLVFAARQFSSLLSNASPKVALCALNPHAGEGGIFGDEESILEESLKMAAAFFDGPDNETGARPSFYGPCPADTVFLRAARGEFDVTVALYHDQGMIPIKLFEPENAVNLTLGLPFIRTSPGHGAAFDIAGKWAALPGNALAAARLAISLTETKP
jgi:4-hydroxythreonine-4-phosphate dehydrogenase